MGQSFGVTRSGLIEPVPNKLQRLVTAFKGFDLPRSRGREHQGSFRQAQFAAWLGQRLQEAPGAAGWRCGTGRARSAASSSSSSYSPPISAVASYGNAAGIKRAAFPLPEQPQSKSHSLSGSGSPVRTQRTDGVWLVGLRPTGFLLRPCKT